MNRSFTWSLGMAAVGCALFGSPRVADACGGTFCDAGPQVMPVDQSGENILFVVDGDRIEAHIQIQYTGDPAQFAWVIPVTSVPDFEAGSQALFDRLLTSTVPTFQLNTAFEDCPQNQSVGCGLFAADASRADEGGLGSSGGDVPESDDDSPDVVKRETVGAFEFVVLQGGTTEELVNWLDDNGYAQDDDAPPILDQYLAEDYLFVAVKLRAGAGLDEIHPIVIRYDGNIPCVPLRLTGIAAEPDMAIRTFFLGEERVVPTNYRHVTWNPLRLDWVNLGANYNELVTLAVDAEGADGHGFVTEYAGDSAIVPADGLWGTAWVASDYDDLPPAAVVDVLERQGLMNCNGGLCTYEHPLVQPILAEFLPPPDGSGVAEDDFYDCLACFESLIDAEAWDPVGFAAAMRQRIFDPAQHAIDLLRDHDYLTRLFTTISPEEMTVDPMFRFDSELGDVSSQYLATMTFACEGPDFVDLPDGRRVALEGGAWPSFDDEMPWSEFIDEYPEEGGGAEVDDQSGTIDDGLETWNSSQGLDDQGCGCRVGGRYGATALVAFVVLAFRIRERRRR